MSKDKCTNVRLRAKADIEFLFSLIVQPQQTTYEMRYAVKGIKVVDIRVWIKTILGIKIELGSEWTTPGQYHQALRYYKKTVTAYSGFAGRL